MSKSLDKAPSTEIKSILIFSITLGENKTEPHFLNASILTYPTHIFISHHIPTKFIFNQTTRNPKETQTYSISNKSTN